MGKSNLEEERIEHPSYAIINIGRAQIGGGVKHLFDSPFGHHHIITLEISPAMVLRQLYGDTVMECGNAPHIRVAMSEIQFAQLVLNANMRGGTPCTVEQIAGKRLPEPPPAKMKKLWANNVKRNFKDVADAVTEVEKGMDELLAQDRITKGGLKKIRSVISTMAQDIRENLPWMQERFQEAMDKTVAVAKGEVAAHLAHSIEKAGLATLKNQPLPLGLDSEGPLEKPK